MKFSESWLREWVDIKISTTALLNQLTFAGLEVESCMPVAPGFQKVVVGEVLVVKPHPETQKLTICQVKIATDKFLTIVCGAENVKQGIKVPVALIGAVLPGNLEIKEAELRGVKSFGMLCSGVELGLADLPSGLLILPSDAPVGELVRNYLQLEDKIIELSLTPNRGDCLSIRGIARDIFAINNLKINFKVYDEVKPEHQKTLSVELKAPLGCPVYLGRIIMGVNCQAQLPLLMQERLRRAGIHSVSIVVDILNYVMLELGQPMHAFDLKQLQGGIVVRIAKPKESLTLLNGNQVELQENTLVIADQYEAKAIAGVIGGLSSSVTDHTVDIFLESAYFNPSFIAGCAKQYGLTTDSAYRFERGVDFNLQRQAIERATQLIIELAGGKAGPVIAASHEDKLPRRQTIPLSLNQVNELLSLELDLITIKQIFVNLGMSATEISNDTLKVFVPSYRFDITIPQDLIEEVARIYGYDKIPVASLKSTTYFTLPTDHFLIESKIKGLFQDLGYHEVITYSFISSEEQQLLEPGVKPLVLANPISNEMAVMRTSLWPGLLKILKYNIARQQPRVRIFEIGKRFIIRNNELNQESVVSGLITGTRFPEQWGINKEKVDFFDLKGDLEQLLFKTKDGGNYTFAMAEHLALHPGQSAKILYQNKEEIGYLGALHPRIVQALNLKNSIYLFELNLNKILAIKPTIFNEVSKFPAVRRDFAILVNKSVTTQCLLETIKKVADKLLVDIVLFDVFTGKEVEEGKRSVAVGLTLQHPIRTLKDEEVVKLSEQIVMALRSQYGAELRE
ncbi:MAG: phenylalanine--tRNA ligase subunit beta [Gammaproteobacteria bacterium RIFCSPHIGHO2_12_FULL_35_23]|nr:MAG: phenylalanine--tRNA ligase subunit beta [Gammaproteobacteria bacterium RIFCSPHIGHO2_12_FULL_35_23]